MEDCFVSSERTRSLQIEGRDLVLRYSYVTVDRDGGPMCRIDASLTERSGDGTGSTTSYRVEMSHVQPDAVKRIFEMIVMAEDPVFPVHVPEIVRDQLSAIRMVAVTSSQSLT